jgi:hypothetical protein
MSYPKYNKRNAILPVEHIMILFSYKLMDSIDRCRICGMFFANRDFIYRTIYHSSTRKKNDRFFLYSSAVLKQNKMSSAINVEIHIRVSHCIEGYNLTAKLNMISLTPIA